MKNQQLTTALLALVLPFLGACSSPATLETNTASSPKTLQAQAAANIVPNAVWQATHGFQLRAYYDNASTFSTTQNGVTITVAYTFNDFFESEDLRFVPGTQANTLTSLKFRYISTKHQIALVKTTRPQISGLRNCTYSLGPQEFSVPEDTFTVVFDPTHTPDQNDYDEGKIPKDWVHTNVISSLEVVSVDATLKSVCEGIYRGQSTTTYTPVTLFRTTQPRRPIIPRETYNGVTAVFVNPNFMDMLIPTFTSGGFHLWR
jgi:hypothetical protein